MSKSKSKKGRKKPFTKCVVYIISLKKKKKIKKNEKKERNDFRVLRQKPK
jgi:hypothetical protein